MLKEDKCWYCNKLAIQDRRIVADVEADHDIDPVTGEVIWYSHPIYQTVGVCADHMEDDGDMREGEE
jgi:hypothetical protein